MRQSFALLALLGACSDAGVTKFNGAPTTTITSHGNDDTVREGDVIALAGTVSDVDDALSSLTVTWTIDGAAVCEMSIPDTSGRVTCEHAFVAGGGEVQLEVRDPSGGSGRAGVSLDVQPTDAPTASISAPTATGTYYSDQIIAFQGTVDDAEDSADQLVVTWETEGLGDLGLEADVTSEGRVEAYGALSEGEHAVRLRVVDTTGRTALESVVIQVGPPNTAPTCALTLPADGSAGPLGSEVRFEGTVDDVDVDESSLTVVWSSDRDGELGGSTPDSDGTVRLAWDDLSVATHLITLRATDEVGGTCTDSIYYTVGTPPSLTITAPTSGDLVSEGENVQFAATVSDGEDLPTDLIVSWESDLDGVFSTQGSDSTGEISFREDALTAGDHTVTVTVTDTDGLYAQRTIGLLVNAPPTLPTVTLAPNPAFTANTLTATASGSTDPDGSGPVSYRYDWYVDGVYSAVSTSTTFPSSDTVKDVTYRVVVTPNDGMVDGPPALAELTVDNTAPVISGPSLSASTVQVGDTLTCTATGTDADGDSLSVTYAWSDGSTGATYTVTASDDPGDALTCTATVDDGDGGTDSGSALAIVQNSAPTVASVSISPNPANNDDTLTCAGVATDPDGDTPTLAYAWTDATTGTTLGSAATLDLAAVGVASTDTLTCTVTASDPSGDTDTDAASITIDNRDPTVGVGLTPASPTASDTLTCTASVSDDDGDTTSASFAWTVDGVSTTATGGSGLTSELSGVFGYGQTVACTVTGDDGKGGTASATASAIITNSPPVVTAVTVTPSSATTNDVLSVASSVSDPEGDTVTVTYDWYVDGVLAQSGTSTTLDGATHFDKDEVVTVEVVATDGVNTTREPSSGLTIQNTPPGAPVLSISPAGPTAGDALTCTVDTASTDDDGDPITYTMEWEVEGVFYEAAGAVDTGSPVWTGPTTTTWPDDTTTGADVQIGETWMCTATPDDGDDIGTEATVDVTIFESAEFTTCGQTGTSGPTQSLCDSAYTATTLDGDVTVTSGIQYWTVPFSGTYQITAAGAHGGLNTGHGFIGGYGAEMVGEFSLTSGDVLAIVVGQAGTNGNDNAGGGGGSFVVMDATSTPLIIAGGGGGGAENDNNTSYMTSYKNGTTGTCGRDVPRHGGGLVSGGCSGNGGTIGLSYGQGGGGGFSGNGGGTGGGKAFLNVAAGSTYGGFGGGGHGGGDGGGGAGGYSGGAGGSGGGSPDGPGGGGGSYNAGSNQTNTSGANTGVGYVIIESI